MKKRSTNRHVWNLLIIATIISASFFLSCKDTSEDEPCLIIHVNLTDTIDETHKVYAIFHANFLPPWAEPWFILGSSSNIIMTPRLSLKSFPLFLEIAYDANGSGGIDSGDFYQGWNGKTDRTTENLDVVVLPKTEIMILYIDLDNHGIYP